MSNEEKIDKIFQIVSRIDKSLGIVETKHAEIHRRVDEHTGQISAMETAVEFFKIENAKLGVMGRAAGFIGGFVGTVLGGVIIGVVTYFVLK